MVAYLGRLSADLPYDQNNPGDVEVAAPTGPLYDWFFNGPDGGAAAAPFFCKFTTDGKYALWQEGTTKAWIADFVNKEFKDIGNVSALLNNQYVNILPSKNKMFVLDSDAGTLSFIDMTTGTTTNSVAVLINSGDVGNSVPSSVAISPDDRYIAYRFVPSTLAKVSSHLYIIDTETEETVYFEEIANTYAGETSPFLAIKDFKFNYTSSKLGIVLRFNTDIAGALEDNLIRTIVYSLSDGTVVKEFQEEGHIFSYSDGVGGFNAPETPYTRLEFCPTVQDIILYNDALFVDRSGVPGDYIHETNEDYWRTPTAAEETPRFYIKAIDGVSYSEKYEYSLDSYGATLNAISDSLGENVFFCFKRDVNVENNNTRFLSVSTSTGTVTFPTDVFLQGITEADIVTFLGDDNTRLKQGNSDNRVLLALTYDLSTLGTDELYSVDIGSMSLATLLFGLTRNDLKDFQWIHSLPDGNRFMYYTEGVFIGGETVDQSRVVIVKDGGTVPVDIVELDYDFAPLQAVPMFPVHAPLPA